MCPFVSNFLSYVSAKYYLNWFTVGKVTQIIKRVNFLLRYSVYVSRNWEPTTKAIELLVEFVSFFCRNLIIL